jgi:hypothetical protein
MSNATAAVACEPSLLLTSQSLGGILLFLSTVGTLTFVVYVVWRISSLKLELEACNHLLRNQLRLNAQLELQLRLTETPSA